MGVFMRILFVIDKVEYKYFEFNDLVTNFWMIKEYSKTDDVYITTLSGLSLKGQKAFALCNKVALEGENIVYNKEFEEILIDDFELVLFRPDPPVDNNYINATYIFDFVKEARVINSPFAIRNFNEKLHSLLFSEYMPESIVSSSLIEIEDFLQAQGEIILKPLDKCFGSGVFYLKQGDKNTRSIINSVTANQSSFVMVQKYLAAGASGDKRVLTLGDRVLDYCIVKHSTTDDFKFNTHSMSYISKGVLSEEERCNFTKVAEKLNSLGIYMAGLDVIDGKIIEINVTSPCYFIKEINTFFNISLEQDLCAFIRSNSCYKLQNVV